MRQQLFATEDDLTDESRRMWENISNLEKINAGISLLPIQRNKRVKVNHFELGFLFIKKEIQRMIINSERVIADCDDIILTYETQEEYLASDAKVAKFIHTKLIERLKKILNLENAFDHEIKLPDE